MRLTDEEILKIAEKHHLMGNRYGIMSWRQAILDYTKEVMRREAEEFSARGLHVDEDDFPDSFPTGKY